MTEKELKKQQEEIERAFKKGQVKALMDLKIMTPREISKFTGISESTVRSWIKKFKEEEK